MHFSEKAMAPHSSTLAWKIPWMEEPGGLQSMGSLRVRHNWTTSLPRTGEGNCNPLQCSCLENPRDGGAWWAAVYGIAQSQTRLKRLSSSSSSSWWTSRLLPCPGYYKQCCDEHWGTRVSFNSGFLSVYAQPRVLFLVIYQRKWKTAHTKLDYS